MDGQYTSITFPETLAEAGINASIDTVGDTKNALAETINALYKTELIKPANPGAPSEHAELSINDSPGIPERFGRPRTGGSDRHAAREWFARSAAPGRDSGSKIPHDEGVRWNKPG